MYKELFTEIEQVKYYLSALEACTKTDRQDKIEQGFTAAIMLSKVNELTTTMLQKVILVTRNEHKPAPGTKI